MVDSAAFKQIESNKKKLNTVKNICLICYVVLETLYKTIFGMYFRVCMERAQCIVGALLLVMLVISYLKLSKDEKKRWLVVNIPVFVYFVIRGITFITTGMEYSVVRSVFFEVIYLFALTDIVVSTEFCKRIIMKMFIVMNLILNILNSIIFLYCEFVMRSGSIHDNVLYRFIETYTYKGDFPELTYCSMYSNPNQIGLMTGIAILIALNYVDKKSSLRNKLLWGIYFIFSLWCVIVSNCSSAHLAMIVVAIVFLIVKYIGFLNGKRIIYICLACCIATTACIYVFAANHQEIGAFTELESKLYYASSGRYLIWKDCYYSHKDEFLLGCGNMTLEKQDRYQYDLDKGVDYGLDKDSSLIDFWGPHNGYIGIISCAGILGLAAFLWVVLRRVKYSRILTKKYWYLTIIFILVINNFECMMPISKNFCTLYMFLILAMSYDHNEKEKLISTEEIE